MMLLMQKDVHMYTQRKRGNSLVESASNEYNLREKKMELNAINKINYKSSSGKLLKRN